MAEYRTVKMSFWVDPYVEELSAEGKLLYIYLFTCPQTNNLGILETVVRRIAYETGLNAKTISALLDDMESQGKIMRDGNFIWLLNFIKNQCTTSPKLVQNMKAMLADVPSRKIRHALCLRYPHIFECSKEDMQEADTVSEGKSGEQIPHEYPTDTVSIPYANGTDTVGIPSGEYGSRKLELINTPPPPSKGGECELSLFQQGESENQTERQEEKYPADFEAFWQLYPRKQGKEDAYKAWKKHKKKIPKLEVLQQAINVQMQSEQWQRKIIPHASTWLNGFRWQDEISNEANGGMTQAEMEAAREFRRQANNEYR